MASATLGKRHLVYVISGSGRHSIPFHIKFLNSVLYVYNTLDLLQINNFWAKSKKKLDKNQLY